VLRADDSAFAEGRGCYTSARVEAGHARFAARHARRLASAARTLGIGELAELDVLAALSELARAAFGEGAGVVRLQASRDAEGALHLVGVPRALGPERPAWSAIRVRLPASGSGGAHGLKVTSRIALALASDAARTAGADEALILDAAGRLVEGARSNVVVVGSDGRLSTPPLELGGVAGIAREILLERIDELEPRVVGDAELALASEIVAVNAVRGARAVVRLDGHGIGGGEPGPWSRRLAEALTAE
jgi:branched-subunit amino acid aminotransferase/4-amino-4-deoxychorismate lyase